MPHAVLALREAAGEGFGRHRLAPDLELAHLSGQSPQYAIIVISGHPATITQIQKVKPLQRGLGSS